MPRRELNRRCQQPDDVAARLLVALERDGAALLRRFQQRVERTKAVIGLVEPGLAALQRLLDHRAPDLFLAAALGGERFERLRDQLDRFGAPFFIALLRGRLRLARRRLRRRLRFAARSRLRFAAGRLWRGAARRRPLLLAHQVVVEDELVAVGDQQVGRGVLDADADDDLVVLAQLGHERREIGVAADDDERLHVRLGVAEVERVDDHADVGGVLARLPDVRDLDQLERRLVHRRLERLVAVPVAIRLLDDDAALEQQALEHLADVELLVIGVADAERDVLEIAEQRHVGDVGGVGHGVVSRG